MTPTEESLPEPEGFTSFHPFIKGVFSQWHPTGFLLDGRAFVTAEQWMMYAKAVLFEDMGRAEAILCTNDPGEQKRHGQLVVGFRSDVWNAHRIGIVYRGNFEKFRQNKGAARQLLNTEPAMLVEANPRDWVWGAGLAVDDPAVQQPRLWKGSNLLGRVLTRVREDLGA